MTSYSIDLQRAKAILQPRIPVLAGSLRKAIDEWNSGLGKYHAILDQSVRGVIINQFWYAYSSQAFRGDAGITLDKHGNGRYYVIDDSLVLRLKHVDDSYRSWNHPTSRARAWDAQISFPTIPPMVKLELGYRVDLTGTVVRDAVVMLNYEKQPAWRWQVWGHPIAEFAVTPKDMLGRVVYSHNDFSGVALP